MTARLNEQLTLLNYKTVCYENVGLIYIGRYIIIRVRAEGVEIGDIERKTGKVIAFAAGLETTVQLINDFILNKP